MSDKPSLDAMIKKVDEELGRIDQLLEGDAPRAEKEQALEASGKLTEVKLKILEIKRRDLANAFGQVEQLLRAEAASLAANPFRAALERIGAVGGIVLGAVERGVAVAGAVEPVDALAGLVQDLLGSDLGIVEEIVERPSPPAKPAVAVSTPPDDEQGRLIAAIASKSKEHGVSAGLLGAVAFVESGFRNVSSPRSSATGPFQFIRSTWRGLVERFGGATGIGEADIGDVEAQAEIAALAFLGYRKALEGVRGLPGHAELYLCHFLGTAAAKACLSGSPARPIDEALREFYRTKQVGEGFADKIMGSNPQLKADGRARSIDEVLELYRARLLDGEARYQHLLQLRVGESPGAATAAPATTTVLAGAAPTESDGGLPKWWAVALAEKDKGVAELPGGEHNPNILKYLASTTIGLDPKFLKDETPWCSAFVNWCVTQSGLKGTNSAKARDWHDGGGWGRPIDAPVKGCIVVLWREREDHPDRLGHVGFFDRQEGETIFLLGGNQGDTISIAPYPRQQLLSYRLSS